MIAVLALAIGVAAYVWYSATVTDSQTSQPKTQAERLPGALNALETTAETDTSSVMEMRLGNPQAPVTAVE